MQTWRPEPEVVREPSLIGVSSLVIAVAIHVAVFVGFWIFAVANGLFEKKEETL